MDSSLPQMVKVVDCVIHLPNQLSLCLLRRRVSFNRDRGWKRMDSMVVCRMGWGLEGGWKWEVKGRNVVVSTQYKCNTLFALLVYFLMKYLAKLRIKVIMKKVRDRPIRSPTTSLSFPLTLPSHTLLSHPSIPTLTIHPSIAVHPPFIPASSSVTTNDPCHPHHQLIFSLPTTIQPRIQPD